jgi:hypothetical protein
MIRKIKDSFKNKTVKVNKFNIILLCIFVFFVIFGIYYKQKNDVKVYEVLKVKNEISDVLKGYLVTDETVVNFSNEDTIIITASDLKRVAKNDIIGIYKNSNYDKYLDKLNQMDLEIKEKLISLPTIYSNEVILIDTEIDYIVNIIKKETSYLKINEYKSKLDELSYKKAVAISNLTPSGEEVRKLIKIRDEYKNSILSNSNNVKAPISGSVIYKLDGAENKFNYTDKINDNNIDEIIKEYSIKKDKSFGIKIVDNYKAIIITNKVDNEYAIVGRQYDLEILDKNVTIQANLIKTTSKYNIFEVKNKVENLIDTRVINIKIIWKQISGLCINKKDIKSINDVNYVTILSLNKYIDIPIKIIFDRDDNVLIQNYSKEEKDELKLSEYRNLNMYDRIVENVD